VKPGDSVPLTPENADEQEEIFAEVSADDEEEDEGLDQAV
jgi:hypothetical protein